MENDKRWIKYYPSISNSWQWQKDDWLKMWLYVLGNTGFADNGRYRRGEFLYDKAIMATSCKKTLRQVKDFISLCIKYGDLQWVKRPSKCQSESCLNPTRLKVMKWDIYQGSTDRISSESPPNPSSDGREIPGTTKEKEALRNKELYKYNKNSDISSKKPKVATPKDPLDKDIKTVTDHIWKTYEQAYKVKPVWEQKIRVNLKRHIQRDGADFVIQVWDCYLGTDDDFLVRNRHIPSVFVSASVYTKYAAKAKQQEARYV